MDAVICGTQAVCAAIDRWSLSRRGEMVLSESVAGTADKAGTQWRNAVAPRLCWRHAMRRIGKWLVVLKLGAVLATSLSFAELKQRSHINVRAQAAGDALDFSQRIRADLPMPPPASR